MEVTVVDDSVLTVKLGIHAGSRLNLQNNFRHYVPSIMYWSGTDESGEVKSNDSSVRGKNLTRMRGKRYHFRFLLSADGYLSIGRDGSPMIRGTKPIELSSDSDAEMRFVANLSGSDLAVKLLPAKHSDFV
jgi:hypothetical protein